LVFLGIENVNILHNENFWELRIKPKKIAFIGGGVISVEIGQSLVRLGCDVSILDITPRILGVTDEETGSYLTEQLEKESIIILNEAFTQRFEDSDTLIYTQGDEEQNLKADYLLIAAGRIPNISGMDLEKAGIKYNKKGIETNVY